MQTTHGRTTQDRTHWSVLAAIATAITASICCIGPLILLAVGISGAWVGNLRVLEPYRPVFILVTLGFLGLAFCQVYRKPKEKCEDGSYCANPKSAGFKKSALWLATVLIAGLFAYPNVAAYLASTRSASAATTGATTEVVLAVRDMTCAGCIAGVTKSLKRLDGVRDVRVTLDPPRAVVIYDPHRTTLEGLISATTQAGYPASVLAEKQEGNNQ